MRLLQWLKARRARWQLVIQVRRMRRNTPPVMWELAFAIDKDLRRERKPGR